MSSTDHPSTGIASILGEKAQVEGSMLLAGENVPVEHREVLPKKIVARNGVMYSDVIFDAQPKMNEDLISNSIELSRLRLVGALQSDSNTSNSTWWWPETRVPNICKLPIKPMTVSCIDFHNEAEVLDLFDEN